MSKNLHTGLNVAASIFFLFSIDYVADLLLNHLGFSGDNISYTKLIILTPIGFGLSVYLFLFFRHLIRQR